MGLYLFHMELAKGSFERQGLPSPSAAHRRCILAFQLADPDRRWEIDKVWDSL